jgi:hypothetical protein
MLSFAVRQYYDKSRALRRTIGASRLKFSRIETIAGFELTSCLIRLRTDAEKQHQTKNDENADDANATTAA